MAARKKTTLLVRASISDILEEPGADTGVVEQGVTFRSRAVADHAAPFTPGRDQEVQQAGATGAGSGGEAREALGSVQPRRAFSVEDLLDRRPDDPSGR